MEASHLLVFAAAYLAAVVLPGPGVTALVSRVLARGTQGASAFIAGFVAGALIWFATVATGFAALASAFAHILVAIRYAGAAYLLFLAWKLWNAPARSPTASPTAPDGHGRLFLTGLAINLGNPKAIAFFLALLPTVVDIRTLTPLGIGEMAIVLAIIVPSVLTSYTLAASRARRVFTSPGAVRRVNKGSAAVMAGTAVTIAIR